MLRDEEAKTLGPNSFQPSDLVDLHGVATRIQPIRMKAEVEALPD
jgi:hypothetical protein